MKPTPDQKDFQSNLQEPRATPLRKAWSVASPLLRVGALGFGGPLAAVAMMRTELVERRRLLSSERFMEGLVVVKLLPGPLSTLLAVFIGTEVAGALGGVLAGVAYIFPAFLMVLAIAVLRQRIPSSLTESAYFRLPMESIQVAVLAVVWVTCWKLFREALGRSYAGQRYSGLVVLFSLLGILAAWFHIPELVILIGAGGLSLLCLQWRRRAHHTRLNVDPLSLFFVFFSASLTVFGTGYMVLPHLERVLVTERAWISGRDFLEAVAWGNLTPGPVVMASTYMGYVIDGMRGAGMATLGIFSAPILLMSLLAPLLRRLLGKPWVEGLLLGILPAVAATIAMGMGGLARSLNGSAEHILWGLLCFVAVFRGLSVPWVFLASAAFGLLRAL